MASNRRANNRGLNRKVHIEDMNEVLIHKSKNINRQTALKAKHKFDEQNKGKTFRLIPHPTISKTFIQVENTNDSIQGNEEDKKFKAYKKNKI